MPPTPRRTAAAAVLAGLLAGCGGDAPPPQAPDPRVPQGAWWNKETMKFPTPPQGFNGIVGWMQAATLRPGAPVEGTVEVAWMRLIERDESGSERVTYEVRYDAPGSVFTCSASWCDGGLFDRYPRWFETNDFVPIPGAAVSGGLLVLPAGRYPDNITHWWTPITPARPKARYFTEIRLRVSGPIAFQAGSDYWRELDSRFNVFDPACQKSNNCEAWISDWLGDTDGAFVTFRAPKS